MKKKIFGIFVFASLTLATVIPVSGYIKTESTSPLFLINTYIDEISPYNIPSSPLLITATGPSDIDDVTLYYRWSKDNKTWDGMKEYSIFENFESGTQNTDLWNINQFGGDARIQWDYGTAHSGSYSCAMDDYDSQQNDNSRNVIYTKYDFTDATNINIDFWEREWNDEAHNAPDSWTGWGNYDVVAYTNDGSTWFEIVTEGQLNKEVFTYFEYNISNDPDFISPANSDFAIAFSQYDNVQLQNDGRAWDDINIEYTIGAPSINWSMWVHSSNPDQSYPWSWNFNFPRGTGYYEFYSIGKIINGEVETAPLVADARCRYTRQPEIFDEKPSNNSKNIKINPELSISISDADSDLMTMDWYSNSSGTWKAFESDKDVEDGTYSHTNSNFSEFGTTYWWYVTVTDDIFTVSSPNFHFTTEENLPPNTPSDPKPQDGEIDVPIYKILSWTGGDPNQGDKVYYDIYFGTSSPPPLVVEDQTYSAYDPGSMELGTTYYWQIISEDKQGESTSGPIWSFTTELESNAPPTAPDIYGSPNGPPGIELFWLFVSRDYDEHDIRYLIDWGDGNSEETEYHPTGEAAEASHTYEEEGDYTIKIKAEDEKGLEGKESSFTLKIQKSRSVYHSLLKRLFERFPNVFPIIRRLLGLM